MKKLLPFVVMMGICLVARADISDTLDTTFTEKEQRQAAFTARTILQNATMVVEETLIQLQAIKDSGNFDTLPADLKAALNRWWQIYKDAKSAFQADSELGDIYQWRKP